METILEPDDHARYLRALNACFPGWGGDAMYRWCFMRAAGARRPERMVLTDERGEWLAGSGISYREIRSGGERVLAGVMTGSWTLPEARGKGLFPAFIQRTRERVAHHGGAAVLGFAGDVQRASTRKLADAGSRCLPSVNGIGSIDAAPANAAEVELRDASDSDAELLYMRWRRRAERAAGFAYPNLAAFIGQFIHRAQPVAIARLDGDGVALIERAEDTDRVLLLDEGASDRAGLYRALWRSAAERGRKLYAYGVGEVEARVFETAGLALKEGYFTILAATDARADAAVCDELARLAWDHQSGDRM